MKLNKHVKKALVGVAHLWLTILGFLLLFAVAFALIGLVVYGLFSYPYIVVITLITLFGALNGLSE